MLMPGRFGQMVLLFFFFSGIVLLDSTEIQCQQRKFPLSKFDNYGCQAKGRVQDCSGKVIQKILAGGQASIPILISQLTDTARTATPIEDYWSYTSSGDIAYIVLTDLFTDADSTFTMPGVPNWTTVSNGCDTTAEGCWREYLQKHGRKSIQQTWLHAWNLWKDQINWDPTARCFRISRK